VTTGGTPGRPVVDVRRVYEATEPGDGYRVLVDRLWPRGVSRIDAAVDEWLKDAAPSTDLRRWYGHEVSRYAEFARRYRAELSHPPGSAAVERLATMARRQEQLTLVTATRDVEHSGATVLQKHIVQVAST
jgi:uncharacterized protein YeaO (DUF488 family)